MLSCLKILQHPSPDTHPMTKKASKKPAHHKGIAPQPAQLDAIRKLLQSGRYDEAYQRTHELRVRFPGFKPLLALSWEAADCAGKFTSATMHAWDWSRAAPGSLAALEALRDSAYDAGFAALFASAVMKLAQAHGEPPPDFPPLHGPLGAISLDQAIASDLSRLYLTFDRFAEAVDVLEGADHPTLRNNLALARFARGEIDVALKEFEENWQRDTRNVFALQHIVQLRLWKDGRAAAGELLPALRNAEALRPEDAAAKVFGLLLLDAFNDALAAWQTLSEAAFWSEDSRTHQSTCAQLAGIAAWRLGNADAANELFSEALDIDSDNISAEDARIALSLHTLGQDYDLRTAEFRAWLPQSWVAELRAARGDAAKDALSEDQQRRCDAHADYLVTAAEQAGSAVRFYVFGTLKMRALSGDSAAIAALRGLLTRPCGPDKVRIDLSAWLQARALIEAGKAHAMLVKGVVTELELIPAHLHARTADIGLPPALQSRMELMHRLLGKHDVRGALRIAEELNAARPDQPTLIGHVATLKAALGMDLDDIEALFRRSAELDPDYLFAQIGLARVAIKRGEIDRAKSLLEPLRRKGEYHFSEWRALLLADHAIAEAEDDVPRANALIQAVESLEENRPVS